MMSAMFTVIPAIDLLDGGCVRLTQGDYARSRTYRNDPSEVAREFAAAGATRLHVVDLDAARGSAPNREAVARIRGVFDGVLEVGGGVRSERDVDELLGAGADRLVIGTVLAREPELVGRWAEWHEGVFIAGIDARDGMVKVSGWREDSRLRAEEVAARAGALRCVSIIYTDIEVDGTGSGPDLEGARAIYRSGGLPVIASGGVGSAADIEAAAGSAGDGIVAVIAGRALYEGALDLGDLLRRFPPEPPERMCW